MAVNPGAMVTHASNEILATQLQAFLDERSAEGGLLLEAITGESELRLRFRRGPKPFEAWIRGNATEVPCFAQTARFRLGYRGKELAPEEQQLLQLIAQELRRIEVALPPLPLESPEAVARSALAETKDSTAPHGGHLEWLALTAGLKPALRSVASPDEVKRLCADAREAGLAFGVYENPSYTSKFYQARRQETSPGQLFVAAREQSTVDQLIRNEQVLADATQGMSRLRKLAYFANAALWSRRGLHGPRLRAVGSTGKLLGYPECCTTFFVSLPNHVRSDNAQLRRVALGRTQGAPNVLLNNLDFGNALLSHFVCSYTCAESLQQATALLEALRKRAPATADRLIARLTETLPQLADGADLYGPRVT